MQPFGTYTPDHKTLKKIAWCQRLPANWLSKQIAQVLRKQVLSQAKLPLDLCIGKVRMRCQLTDNISERGFVFMPWRWDAIERQVMLDSLAADGVMIDIGANVGIYSALAATKLKRMGVVVAIEPNPDVHQRLAFNLAATTAEMSDTPRVELLQLGISDCSGEFSLFLDDDNLGASSLLNNPSKQNSIKVTCVTLLETIHKLKLSRVDVIKCDIEGAEDRALIPYIMDAPNHLLPQCIIFENNQRLWQDDLLSVLQHRDYIQTHQTRLNYIYQLRQPIRHKQKAQAFKNPQPATVAS